MSEFWGRIKEQYGVTDAEIEEQEGKPLLEALQLFHQRKMNRIFAKPWGLGFHNRGHGHGDFAVLAGEDFVVAVEYREIAEYLIGLHNASLEKL